jgi:hypothetical protein
MSPPVFKRWQMPGRSTSQKRYTAPGVADLLAGHDVVEFDAPLHGVEGNARVYRIVR